MKALRVCSLALILCAALSSAALAAETGRVLNGELVVTDAAANRFRVVGHNGSFTAPAGTPLQALDGRDVQVELSANGRVAQVTEISVPIAPVTHGWSTVRGQLTVIDAPARQFTFAGDDRVYAAPPSIDVTPYAGKLVEITLDENGRVTELRLLASPQASSLPPAYVPPVDGVVPAPACSYRGQVYSAGAAVCQSGTTYRCDGSQWHSLGVACQVSDARPINLPPRAPRSCLVGDATVASGSGICRSGTTFRCDDGTWIDVRTACR
jgi:hypothetical protein